MSILLSQFGIHAQQDTFEPLQETLDWISDVESDGGTTGNIRLIDAAIKEEIENDRISEPLFYFTAQGRKGDVDELYMLHDVNETWTFSGFTIDSDGIESLARSSTLEWTTLDSNVNSWCFWGWINATGVFSDSRQGIIGRTAGASRSCAYDVNGENRLQYRDDGNNLISTDSPVALKESWRFICFQGNASNIRKYVDGIKIRDSATSEPAKLRLSDMFDVNSGELHGKFDLFCLREANVSDQEVTDLYNATKFYFQ